MATLGIPAHGYGIRYDHGIFRQVLKDGWQIELPEDWLSSGNPWEFERPEVAYTVGFGGTVDTVESDDGTRALRVESGRERAWRWPTTRRSPAGAGGTSTRCGCGRRARSIRCALERVQPRRPRRRARRPRAPRGDLARALPERRDAGRARAAAAAGVSSSPRPRCRTSCAGTRRSTASSRRCPTTSRSS